MAKSVTMVRLDDDLKRISKEQAEREGRSLSSLIALAVRFYVQEHLISQPKPSEKPRSTLNTKENS